MTFNEVADLFEQSRFEDLSPGSLAAYRPALQYARGYFRNDYIAEIKPKDIAKYLDVQMQESIKKQLEGIDNEVENLGKFIKKLWMVLSIN